MKKFLGNLLICVILYYLLGAICGMIFGNVLVLTILIPFVLAIIATVIGNLYQNIERLEKRIAELEEGRK